MKTIDKVKSLFRRRPLTEEELSARDKAESARAQAEQQIGEMREQVRYRRP